MLIGTLLSPVAHAHNLAYILFVFETVAGQRIERNQPFDKHILQFDEEPKARG